MKIIVGQECDAVTFMIVPDDWSEENDDDGEQRFYSNQEDTFEDMVKFFKALGFEAEYQEWC